MGGKSVPSEKRSYLKTGISHRTRAEKVDNYRAIAAKDEGEAFPVFWVFLKERPLLTLSPAHLHLRTPHWEFR
jgi:hypothetical protein